MVTKELIDEINGLAQEDLPKVQTKEGFIASAEDQDFGAHFSRDAEIDSFFSFELLKKAPEQPEILTPVKDSLVTMAKTQGQVFDSWRDEEPGKIIHEYRHSANPKNQQRLKELMGKFPVEQKNGLLLMHYYGSIDATPLFEWVACEYIMLAKDYEFFSFLDPHIRAAFSWSQRKYNESAYDGYIGYCATNRQALINQGWKDSWDSILTEDGKHPKEPIALVEVQGYQYRALIVASELYSKIDPEFARKLLEDAVSLKERFSKDFWIENKGFFAHALDGDGRQINDIVSNTGHLLMTGIVDDDKLPLVVSRLMQPDMFTPFGIRPLSSQSPHFSDEEPSAYHRGGGVWPHDNELICLGLENLGYSKEAEKISEAVLEAEGILKNQYGIQNTELYIVDRNNHLRPYKAAQRPQSWGVYSNLNRTERLKARYQINQ